MNKGILAFILYSLCGALMLTCNAACAASGKKLLEWGIDMPTTRFMRDSIADMEKAPFDGVAFHVRYPYDAKFGFDTPVRADQGDLSWFGWGKRIYTREELQFAVDDLKATRFQRFTDNFLRFGVTPGDVDWFDDFGSVLSNARNAAWIAKQGGVKGILFEAEPYMSKVWHYPSQKNASSKSFEDYAKQVRRRGAEFMRVMQLEYSEITIILGNGYEIAAMEYVQPWPYLKSVWPDSIADVQKLHTIEYGLLPAFLDGMLDAVGPQARIVCAPQTNKLNVLRPLSARDRALMEKGVLPLVADPKRYREKVSFGFFFWVDAYWRVPGKGFNHEDFTGNYFRPGEVQAALTNALNAADEYTWVYTEHLYWWGPSRNVPAAYGEAVSAARDNAGQGKP